jgi:hypothetical protein
VEEENRQSPVEVEIVGLNFDVLVQRNARQELLYVLNRQNFLYRLRPVDWVDFHDKRYCYRRKPSREPEDICLFFYH